MVNGADMTATRELRFWVFARDYLTANDVLKAHIEATGLLDPSEDAAGVELQPVDDVCVFFLGVVPRPYAHRQEL